MKLSIIAAAAVLSGCAGLQSVPTTVTVKVPVPVACVVPDIQKPAFAVDALPVGSDIFTQSKTFLADRKQHIDYENQLESVLGSLKKDPAQ